MDEYDVDQMPLPDSPSESSRSPSPLQVVQETEHIQLTKVTRSNNKRGLNGHKLQPPLDDEMKEVLFSCWNRGVTKWHYCNQELNRICGRSYSSDGSYKRALQAAKIGPRISQLSLAQVEQFVVLAMAGDLAGATGIRGMMHKLRSDGRIVTRRSVWHALRDFDPDGIASRTPGSKTTHRFDLNFTGPDEQWAGDGHDKLHSVLGIGIYAWRDCWTGKYIAMRIFPSNRTLANVHWFFLDTCCRLGGYPLTTATDRGSEVSDQAATQIAFRETFSEPAFADVVPGHVFLPSPRNITVERGWVGVRENVVDHVKVLWSKSGTRYNQSSQVDRLVALWLFPPLVQITLDKYAEFHNTYPVRFQKKKLGPSGGARMDMYHYPERWNGRPCLQRFGQHQGEIEALRDVAREKADLDFVIPEIAEVCARGMDMLGEAYPEEWTDNTWNLFARLVAEVREELTTLLQQ